MCAARSDAATSTDDIVKGPLCLFYFAHPFGVLSCEPPTVIAPPPPAPADAPPSEPAPTDAMPRRSPTWPTSSACARRLPPYTRTLPPLKLPTPMDSSSVEDSEDVWSRSSFTPPEKMSLPPIELPAPTSTAAPSSPRAPRLRRLGPVGVRKGGARSRGAALARLLRRAVATGGAGVERSPRGISGALAPVRAAWQPAGATTAVAAVAREATHARAASGSPQRSSWASNSSTICIGGEEESVEAYVGRFVGVGDGGDESGDCGTVTDAGEMGPRAPLSPAPAHSALLHRRYSVPETVMRRYRLARESEAEEEAAGGGMPAPAPRDLVRRSALVRRMGGAGATVLSPCCCDTRSLNGSRSEVSQPLVRGIRSPQCTIQSPMGNHRVPVPASKENHYNPLPTADLLEIVVSETSPPVLSRPSHIASNTSRSSDCNLNIDEYVSNILVDSLNSLTDRLESMTVSIGGGEGRISVVEKEIKVKLQNKAVNTVVHLSPTSNNQIIFGNRELCERDTINASLLPVEGMLADEFQVTAESWRALPRVASPCASLVDSLDDPMSPRAAPPPPPPPQSAPPQPLLPSPPPLPLQIQEPSQSTPLSSDYTDVGYLPLREKCESFFIRMNEDNCACEKENIVVADHMPEKIKQRLYRRHRRREMRAQGARRGAARRGAQRDIQRQCAALVDALIDDAIAKIAREEYRYMRIARHRESGAPKENALTTRVWNGRGNNIKGTKDQRQHDDIKATSLNTAVLAPSPPAPRDRVPPRRLYHKSEIHDGGKCVEILEIVEYANTPRSSSETNSDESPNATRCARKSRIPVPIQDKMEQPRVRRGSVTSSNSSTTGSSATPRRASVPGAELCTSSRSMRFERVFDVIPEERSSLSLESASEDMRAVGTGPPSRRSAATSPLAPAPPGSTAGSVERIQNQKERGHGRRSIGTQWTRTPQLVKQHSHSSEHKSGMESELQEQEQSSSECELESVGKVLPRARPQSARRRVMQRVRRRALRPAPAPPLPPPPPPHQPHPPHIDTENASHNMPENNSAKAHSDSGDGWSLTLAGSCRAALPSRVDLRLRFPSHAGAGVPPATSSRSDAATTDRYSDAGSQDRDWSMCKRTTAAMHCAQAAPAIRYNSTAESLPARAPALERARAPPGRRSERDPRGSPAAPHPLHHDALPALSELPLRRTDVLGRGARCRCCARGSGGVRAGILATAAGTPRPTRASRDTPASPAPTPRLEGLHHAALLPRRRDVGEMKASGAAAALAVLGCAIVPERRLAPPTASQRDLLRARRLAARARAPSHPAHPSTRNRRHSFATTTTTTTMDSNIHCLCYAYT